jgi:hypothetical protein
MATTIRITGPFKFTGPGVSLSMILVTLQSSKMVA